MGPTMGRSLCLSLALLFLANVIPSKAQKGEAAETRVSVAEGAPLTLECQLRPEQPTEWRWEGGALPAGVRVEPERPAPDGRRLAARLTAAAARARHAGLYTCSPERDQRVRLVVQAAQSAPPAAAPPAGAVPTTEANEAGRAGGADGDVAEVVYEVRGKTNFSLFCQLPNDNGREYIWKKNDTLVSEVHELANRYKLEAGGAQLTVPRGHEDDWGNYSCALGGAAGEQRWAVRGNPYAKLPPNTNVVEGQKLKLVCKVIGKPYPAVTWWYTADANDPLANYTEVRAALGERVTLNRSEAGVPDGVLLVAAAARADAGRYNCTPSGAPLTHADSTVLRVKDMYAALWPFLGICAEVFILCAIILVYEKRRTKPELDDSDTDNHEQKKS